MDSTMVKSLSLGRRLLLACWAVVALGDLSGCAAPKQETGPSGGSELVTQSDEPDARKRARIRLELAVGYFEQGQTTVALDELKQSIASDPTYSEGYNLRGLIYMRLNDYRFAEESFRKALSLSPRDANVMHNLGWMLCQQSRYPEAMQVFGQALANPQYAERAKTFRAQGLCQVRAGQLDEAQASLLKSYEFDAGNPITAYNLASLLFQKNDMTRALFYVRRLNNSELANSESLWLGIKVERRLKNSDAVAQLAGQLVKRFPQSREASAYQRGAFDE
jgi:type IV pilus assembly protein PilF